MYFAIIYNKLLKHDQSKQ